MSPHDEYARRLAERKAALARAQARDRRFSNARLLTFIAVLVVGVVGYASAAVPGAWALAPLAVFLVLVVVHDGVVRARDRTLRAVTLYEDGVRRLEGTWPGTGIGGEAFADVHHLYAADLDLFGRGSMFERLCRARTSFGEAALARWLLEPAAIAELRRRHRLIDALRARLELREDLALLGETVRAETKPADVLAWTRAREPIPAWAAGVAPLLVVVTAGIALLVALAAVPAWAIAPPLVVEAAFALWWRAPVARVLASGALVSRELALLAAVLARLERERDEPLAELLAALVTDGRSPSQHVERLSAHVARLDWAANQLFLPFALVLLWRTQHAFALERWRRAVGDALERWLDAVGEAEALSSLAAYAFENPGDPFPELVERAHALVEGEALGHPLLRDGGVRNDVKLGDPARLYMVSGSNMSGKSTYLRTLGLNVVLAQAGAPVKARRLVLTPLVVGATLRVQDSLAEGASRFYAEITRLKQLLDAAGRRPPLLFLVDELLAGTNSHDRRVGAGAVLESLLERGAIGLATTHDLALADVATALGERARNVHFSDRLDDGEVTFDYRLHDGVVTRSNALDLMRAVGLLAPAPRA